MNRMIEITDGKLDAEKAGVLLREIIQNTECGGKLDELRRMIARHSGYEYDDPHIEQLYKAVVEEPHSHTYNPFLDSPLSGLLDKAD